MQQLDALPSTDAVGDWLRRTATGAGLKGLDRINRRAVAARIRQTGITALTLDGDASQTVAEKGSAHFTYQGEQGYMPMIGHLAETGVVIYDEFWVGNITPATKNLEFTRACEARLPKGYRIVHVRLDSVGSQAELFNLLAPDSAGRAVDASRLHCCRSPVFTPSSRHVSLDSSSTTPGTTLP